MGGKAFLAWCCAVLGGLGIASEPLREGKPETSEVVEASRVNAKKLSKRSDEGVDEMFHRSHALTIGNRTWDVGHGTKTAWSSFLFPLPLVIPVNWLDSGSWILALCGSRALRPAWLRQHNSIQ